MDSRLGNIVSTSRTRDEEEMSAEETLDVLRVILTRCKRDFSSLVDSCEKIVRKEYTSDPDLPQKVVDSFQATDDSLDQLFDYFIAIGAITEEEDDDDDDDGKDEDEVEVEDIPPVEKVIESIAVSEEVEGGEVIEVNNGNNGTSGKQESQKKNRKKSVVSVSTKFEEPVTLSETKEEV